MALPYRRDPAGRSRFLIALSLSTVTALGVAAPLAIQAINADEPAFVSGDPVLAPAAEADAEDGPNPLEERSLDPGRSEAMGGISSRPPAKGQGQTSKSESDVPVDEPEAADEQVLTNEPAPAPADQPPSVSSTTAAPTTSTTAPKTTTTGPTTTTTRPTTTSTTGPTTTTRPTTTSSTGGSMTTTSTTATTAPSSTAGPTTTAPTVPGSVP